MNLKRFTAFAVAAVLIGTVGPTGAVDAVAIRDPGAAGTEPVPSQGAGKPWLVYARGDLYLSRTDGADEHPLIDEPVQEGVERHHADWSPDGSTIAFEVLADDASVWTVRPDGSALQQRVACLAVPCLQIAEPAWSPDGASLLVVQYDEGPAGTWGSSWLVVVDVATGGRRAIARTGKKSAFYFPRWSPDGRRVVVEIDRFTDSTQSEPTSAVIGVLRADRPGIQPVRILTKPTLLANHPDWHPRKNLLVFSTNDPILFPASTRPSNVFVMRPNGKGLRQVSHQSTDGRMRLGQTTWAPDGRRVVLIVAKAATNGGVVETKYPAFLSVRQGTLRVLPNRGADPRLQP